MSIKLSSFSFKNGITVTLLIALLLLGIKFLEPAFIDPPAHTPTYAEQYEVMKVAVTEPIVGLEYHPEELEVITIKRGNSNMHKK